MRWNSICARPRRPTSGAAAPSSAGTVGRTCAVRARAASAGRGARGLVGCPGCHGCAVPDAGRSARPHPRLLKGPGRIRRWMSRPGRAGCPRRLAPGHPLGREHTTAATGRWTTTGRTPPARPRTRSPRRRPLLHRGQARPGEMRLVNRLHGPPDGATGAAVRSTTADHPRGRLATRPPVMPGCRAGTIRPARRRTAYPLRARQPAGVHWGGAKRRPDAGARGAPEDPDAGIHAGVRSPDRRERRRRRGGGRC